MGGRVFLSQKKGEFIKCWTGINKGILDKVLRSLHRFAVRNSSAHGGKIIIFEIFQCSLTKTIQLN